MENLMRKFSNRKHLKRKHPDLKVSTKNGREYIYIDDLLLIARFIGFIKFEYNRLKDRSNIFIRGQTTDYEKLTPSLFRKETDEEKIRNKLKAYEKLKEEIYDIKKAERFKGRIGGAILQHYGLKTPWIDLVDNLFIGLWFARNKMVESDDSIFRIEKSNREFGWIYFIKTDSKDTNPEGINIGETTQWCDLRNHHNSLSLRPHVQHGIFIAKNNYTNSPYDLTNEIVATIKFPIKPQNDIEDLPVQYLFPDKSYDNTYKYLLESKITDKITEVESKFSLEKNELGRIFSIQN